MSRQYINKEVVRLVRKWHTRNPFEILDRMNVVIRESGAFQELKGFCFVSNRIYYVVLNERLLDEEKRIVAAHELGHIVLHKDRIRMAPMKDTALYTMSDRTEYEANLFAAELLLSDEEIKELTHREDMDYFQMCQNLNVSPELMSFKLFGLIQRGEPYQLPMDLDSRFLGK